MRVQLPSTWFTAVRIRRLGIALQRLPGASPGVAREQAARQAWRECGGPFDEVDTLLGILHSLGLIREKDETVLRSAAGNKVVKGLRRGDVNALAICLIRAGYFFDQARALIENGSVGDDESLVANRRIVLAVAPQLVAVLDLWGEVEVRPRLRIPKQLLAELDTVWSLLPPEPVMPVWAQERKSVGNRAEMYTVQYERSRCGDRSAIAWVARDSDSLGYDVEDRSVSPSRCIEVKGRRDRNEIFFLSENEKAKAEELGGRYELHFWGAIDLRRDAQQEYAALRAEGYPMIIPDLLAAIDSGDWTATPTTWRVERAAP